MILDEPTNHLDADSVVWLREFLKAYQGGFIVISHNVALVEETVNRVFYLDGNRQVIDIYNMGWKHYLRQREADAERRKKERAGVEKKASQLQQQAAGMLRFLSHECRSPLFVVLLILNNLIEADLPDVQDSCLRAAAGDGPSAQAAGEQLLEVNRQLSKMQKPLQLLRSVLDNMLSYLKLKQKRRMRLMGLCGTGEGCPYGVVDGEEPQQLDAGAVMTEIGSMFPVLVDAMECTQPKVTSTFRLQSCRCDHCEALHPHVNSSHSEGMLSSLQCLPVFATVQATTLKQALTNLLTNAVKYGSRGKAGATISVDVSLECLACDACLSGPETSDVHPSMLATQSSGCSSGGVGGSFILNPALSSAATMADEACTPTPHVSISVQGPSHSTHTRGTLTSDAILENTPGTVHHNGAAVDVGGTAVPVVRLPAKLVISVSDQGRGLSAEELALLFRPFERLRAGQQQQGSGLGLWLMHELLDFQGGTIAVTRAGKDTGSTFAITVPCFVESRMFSHLLDSEDPGAALVSNVLAAGPSSDRSTSSRGGGKCGSETPESALSGLDGKTPSPAHGTRHAHDSPSGTAAMMLELYPDVPDIEALGGEGASTAPSASTGTTARTVDQAMRYTSTGIDLVNARPGLRRVLLVDDSKAVLQQLANAMKRRGFKVSKATDGASGLEKMRNATEPFDLVVCDFEMPVMNGPQLAAALREAAAAMTGSVGTASPVPWGVGNMSATGSNGEHGGRSVGSADVEVVVDSSSADASLQLQRPSSSSYSGDSKSAVSGAGTGFTSWHGGLPGLKRGTPTIFIGLTGNAMGADVEHFKQSGAHAVLIKPANPGTICSTATELQTAFLQGGHRETAMY
jgi:signal transduction histidine kinase